MIEILWFGLLFIGVILSYILIRDIRRFYPHLEDNSWTKLGAIGFVCNFFDVLGIGSFATETTLFRFFKQVNDRIIPGTLIVANAIPTIAQALIFTKIIQVEVVTLTSMVVAAVVGSSLGSRIVARLSERNIRRIMGIALWCAAGFMLSSQLGWASGQGDATGLTGLSLYIAVFVNLILGILMTAGIGLYAPCMALVYAMGMSPQVAFPIMMTSCAFLMPTAAIQFIKKGAYNRRATIFISILGTIGVLIAAFMIKSLPTYILKWIVIAVVMYAGTTLLKAGIQKK